jgi:molybdopterin synthase sulfur carrier subunit
MANIIIPIALRAFTGRESEIEVEVENVRAALDALTAEYPELTAQIFEENGDLRGFINIFVEADNIKVLQGLDTAIKPSDEIAIVPAIAGGLR